jgi:hypothetical protein
MKARYFYAKAVYNTWRKLFVLTEDNVLYCEYLNYMVPAKIIKKASFENFKATDYKWNNYQTLEEVDYDRIINIKLTSQNNWIDSYLNSKKEQIIIKSEQMEELEQNVEAVEKDTQVVNEEFINIPGYFIGKKKDIKWIGQRNTNRIAIVFYDDKIHEFYIGDKFEEVMKSIVYF